MNALQPDRTGAHPRFESEIGEPIGRIEKWGPRDDRAIPCKQGKQTRTAALSSSEYPRCWDWGLHLVDDCGAANSGGKEQRGNGRPKSSTIRESVDRGGKNTRG